MSRLDTYYICAIHIVIACAIAISVSAQQVHIWSADSLAAPGGKTMGVAYSNDTIRLLGTKVSVPGCGAYTSGADNVVFDFQNDTLEFGTAGGLVGGGGTIGSWGLKFGGTSNNCVIRGGHLLHTRYDTAAYCVYIATQAKGNRWVGTRMTTAGHNANCVFIGSFPSQYNNEWDSLIFENKCKSFNSRESYQGAVFNDGGPNWQNIGGVGGSADTFATNLTAPQNTILAKRITMTENGVVYAMAPRYSYETGTTPYPKMRCAIYTLAGALVDSTYTFNNPTNSSNYQISAGARYSSSRNLPFINQATLTSGQTYYICFWVNGNANMRAHKTSTPGTSNFYKVSQTFGGWPLTIPSFGTSVADSTFSLTLYYRQTDYQFGNKITNCTIIEGHGQGFVNKNVMILTDNVGTLDARNDRWDTMFVDKGLTGSIGQSASNSYFLISRGGQPGTEVARNTVYAGTTYQGCRGFDIENTYGIPSKRVKYYDNTLFIHEGPQSEPADVAGTCRVIRGRSIDGGYSAYTDIYNNDATAVVDDNAATKWIGKNCRVLNFGFPNNESPDTCKIYNNHFTALVKSGSTTVQAFAGSANFISSTVSYAWPHVWKNNKYTTSHYGMCLGDADNTIEASKMVPEGDTISYLSAAQEALGYADLATQYPITAGFGDQAMDNVIKNFTYLEGAPYTAINFQAGAGGNAEIAQMRTVTLTVVDQGGNLVENATVKGRNHYQWIVGNTSIVGTGTTNAQGKHDMDVLFQYDAEDTPDSALFNAFRFVALYSGDSASVDYTVSPTTRAVTITLPGNYFGNDRYGAIKGWRR